MGALDALRGLAALAVVGFHYTLLTPYTFPFKYGVTGVDIFFLFSGFVVLLSFKEGATLKNLVVNRIARLYPAYWSAVLFTGFLFWFYNVHTREELHSFILDLGANLTMFQYYLQRPNLDGPYWTMTYEVLFFLFMLGVFAFKGMRRIERVALGGILFTGVQNFIFKMYWPDAFSALQKWVPILSHFALFMAGILFYKIRTEGMNLFRVMCILLAYVMQLSSFENGGMSHIYITFPEYFVILTFYFLLMFLLMFDRLNFLEWKLLLYFGAISYPLFLVHQFVSRSVIIAVLVRYNGFSYLAASLVALAFCIGLATLINRYVEKQAGHWIRKAGGISK